jgi:DNA-binding PadR family transcriptional regulator
LRGLLDRPRAWRHGYELSKQTALPSGTLYPILVRLTERGFLEAKWEPAPEPGRPPRHLYRLTASGRAHARDELVAAEDQAQGAPAGSRA